MNYAPTTTLQVHECLVNLSAGGSIITERKLPYFLNI
jgi:hypothetical protein